MILRKQGYILGNNVIISNRGVYKVGAKLSVLIM